MKVITLGSKIFDDAIKSMKINIINEERITDISPFVFSYNYKYKNVGEEDTSNDDYIRNLARYDITGKDWKENLEIDVILLDLIDARIPFIEFVYETGEVIRVSEGNKQQYEEEFIKNSLHVESKIIECRRINPLLMSDIELEQEIKNFAVFLQEKYDISRMVLLENYNVSQIIDKNYELSIVPNYNKIEEYNTFYKKCETLLKKHIEIKNLSVPKPNIGDARKCEYNFFLMSQPYYKFLINCVLHPENELDYRKTYEIEIFDMINMTEMAHHVEKIKNRKEKRELMFLGDSKSAQILLKEKYNLEISKCIDYFSWTKDEDLEVIMRKELKSSDFFLVINRIYPNSNILNLLKNMNMVEDKDYIIICHKKVKYIKFSGKINDVFNNSISCSVPTNIEIAGWGNTLDVRATTEVSIHLNSLNIIKIDEKVRCGLNSCMEVYCNNCSKVSIGENTSIMNSMQIMAESFSSIEIGKDCLFSSDVKLKILNHNFWKPLSAKKIKIGDAVWLGYRVFIMSDTTIGDGSIIGARASLCDKEIPNNCIAAGEDGKIIRKNVVWDVDQFLHTIGECDTRYIRVTEGI